MSLKKKLFIVYTLAIFMPLLIFGFGMSAMNKKMIQEVESEFGKREFDINSSNESRFLNDIYTTTSKDDTLLLRESFVELLFDRTKDLGALRLFYDGEKMYQFTRSFPDINEDLESSSVELSVNDKALIIEYDYTQRFKINPERRFQKVFADRFMVSISVYLLLHGLFIYFVLRSTIPHLDKLKKVAETIGNGDFDFTVDTNRKDEIGQVYKAFDNMRESLMTYENNRKDLITNISHDLKTPITTIKGYITGIKDGLANTPEKQMKYLDIIYNNSVHLDNLIDDLFLFSKLDVGKVDFNFTNLHFDKYIDYYIDELKLELEDKQVQIMWNMPDISNSIVSADGFKIKRVLNNIVNNAIKHFDKEDKILKFELTNSSKDIILCITDNGSGIPSDKIESIFNRFFRANDSRNTNLGSSGLGLAIAKQIIESHGGEITASSSLGISTSICVKLPLYSSTNNIEGVDDL